MAAPTSANMENCDPKCKCSSGPYADQAFLCADPCAGQGSNCTFDCQNGCDCPECYEVATTVTIEIVANLSNSEKFGCGQINCNIDCNDRGEQTDCGVLVTQVDIDVPAGKCLYNFDMTRGRFFTEFSTDVCPGPVAWPDLLVYAQWFTCNPGDEPGSGLCPFAAYTFNPATGCEGGFTYTWSVVSTAPSA